jgi:hypothetical protein
MDQTQHDQWVLSENVYSSLLLKINGQNNTAATSSWNRFWERATVTRGNNLVFRKTVLASHIKNKEGILTLESVSPITTAKHQ